MSISELITYTRDEFQAERPGIKELNTFTQSLHRLLLEAQEAEVAYYTETPEATIDEVHDIILFAVTMLSALADEHNISPEEIENRLTLKMRKNERRYHPDHFRYVGYMVAGREYTIDDAIKRARQTDKIPHWEGGDYY